MDDTPKKLDLSAIFAPQQTAFRAPPGYEFLNDARTDRIEALSIPAEADVDAIIMDIQNTLMVVAPYVSGAISSLTVCTTDPVSKGIAAQLDEPAHVPTLMIVFGQAIKAGVEAAGLDIERNKPDFRVAATLTSKSPDGRGPQLKGH